MHRGESFVFDLRLVFISFFFLSVSIFSLSSSAVLLHHHPFQFILFVNTILLIFKQMCSSCTRIFYANEPGRREINARLMRIKTEPEKKKALDHQEQHLRKTGIGRNQQQQQKKKMGTATAMAFVNHNQFDSKLQYCMQCKLHRMNLFIIIVDHLFIYLFAARASSLSFFVHFVFFFASSTTTQDVFFFIEPFWSYRQK